MSRTTYEREWTTARHLPANTRLRFGLTKRRGIPIQFVVQLEYKDAEEWMEVARIGHDRDGPDYRNIEKAGMHIDLYLPNTANSPQQRFPARSRPTRRWGTPRVIYGRTPHS